MAANQRKTGQKPQSEGSAKISLDRLQLKLRKPKKGSPSPVRKRRQKKRKSGIKKEGRSATGRRERNLGGEGKQELEKVISWIYDGLPSQLTQRHLRVDGAEEGTLGYPLGRKVTGEWSFYSWKWTLAEERGIVKKKNRSVSSAEEGEKS